MLSPWPVFGNRPAHQEGAPDFQWVRAGSCGDDVLLAPTAPTAQRGGRGAGRGGGQHTLLFRRNPVYSDNSLNSKTIIFTNK